MLTHPTYTRLVALGLNSMLTGTEPETHGVYWNREEMDEHGHVAAVDLVEQRLRQLAPPQRPGIRIIAEQGFQARRCNRLRSGGHARAFLRKTGGKGITPASAAAPPSLIICVRKFQGGRTCSG